VFLSGIGIRMNEIIRHIWHTVNMSTWCPTIIEGGQ
jgi:hypothetical protein